jgi:hypothetical protein
MCAWVGDLVELQGEDAFSSSVHSGREMRFRDVPEDSRFVQSQLYEADNRPASVTVKPGNDLTTVSGCFRLALEVERVGYSYGA